MEQTPDASQEAKRAVSQASKLKGVALLIAAIVLWGANWPVMKAGLSHIGPIWFSATRFALGALCLFAIQAVTGTLRVPTRRDLPLVLSVGVFQMLAFTVLGAMAMTQVAAGRSAILAYTTPLWVTPAAVLFGGERPSARQMIGTALGILGVVVLVNPMTLDWHQTRVVHANLMLLAAAFCWAMCIIHLRHHRDGAAAYLLAPWQMLVATLPLMIMARWVEGPYNGDGSPAFWRAALFVGIVATAFCFCAVNSASKWLSSTSMASAMLAVPVVGLLASVLFLGEKMSIVLTIGLLAIVAGMATAVTGSSAAPKPR